MQQIVVATGNQGKLREIAAALTDFPYILSPQSDFALSEAVEDGHSFVENALIKARHANDVSRLFSRESLSTFVPPCQGLCF